MNKFMTKNRDRFAATLAVLVAAIALTACGGGGGGGTVVTPHPVTTPAPTVLLSSVVPATGATNVSVNVKPVFTFAVTNVTAINTVTAFVCNSKQVTYLATADLTSIAGSATISFAPMASLTNGDSCTMTSDVTATGTGGSAKTTVNTSFTVEALVCVLPQVFNSTKDKCVDPAPTAWWPPTFVPMGTKVYLNSATAPAGAVVNATYPGQTQSGLLPVACVTKGDACWKEAVKNGTIKFVQTTATNPHQSTRSVVFGSYKTVSTISYPGTVLSCVLPFFADDGSFINPNDSVEGGCTVAEKVYSLGNSQGDLFEEKNSQTGVSACYQEHYDQVLDGWVNTVGPCQ